MAGWRCCSNVCGLLRTYYEYTLRAREAAFRENVKRSVIYFVVSVGFPTNIPSLWAPLDPSRRSKPSRSRLPFVTQPTHPAHLPSVSPFTGKQTLVKERRRKYWRGESRRRRDEHHNFLLFANLLEFHDGEREMLLLLCCVLCLFFGI